MRILFFLFFLFAATYSAKAQNLQDSLSSASLDSIINRIRPEKTKLVYTKAAGIIIDSTLFRKASYSLNKKQVKIIFADYSNTTIDANEFWGLITDFGQCQRFYNGQIYIVWHTKAPYIYRDYAASDRKIKYFYSKTLTSAIVPLTKENIHEISDEKTIGQLQAYLKTHDIEKSKDGGPSLPPGVRIFSDEGMLSDFIMFHVHMAWAIAEIMMRCHK